MRAQVRPRTFQVPRPTSGMRAPWASTTGLLVPLLDRWGCADRVQRPYRPSASLRKSSRNIARRASHARRRMHPSATPSCPGKSRSRRRIFGHATRSGTLHTAHLDLLLVVEPVVQPPVRLVEDVVPHLGLTSAHATCRPWSARGVRARILDPADAALALRLARALPTSHRLAIRRHITCVLRGHLRATGGRPTAARRHADTTRRHRVIAAPLFLRRPTAARAVD